MGLPSNSYKLLISNELRKFYIKFNLKGKAKQYKLSKKKGENIANTK